MTYKKRCWPSGECELPLGCFFDVRHVRSYCTDSQCEADAQGAAFEVCRILPTWGGGPFVRMCIPVGPRQEGEGCVALPRDKRNSCVAGLLCGGRGGWCSRPCSSEDGRECPEGFFCAGTIPQPLCLPTCETRGCPAGQQCIPFSRGSQVRRGERAAAPRQGMDGVCREVRRRLSAVRCREGLRRLPLLAGLRSPRTRSVRGGRPLQPPWGGRALLVPADLLG